MVSLLAMHTSVQFKVVGSSLGGSRIPFAFSVVMAGFRVGGRIHGEVSLGGSRIPFAFSVVAWCITVWRTTEKRPPIGKALDGTHAVQ
jgi:hypothetical protein